MGWVRRHHAEKRDEAPADVGTRQKQISGATKGRMGFWVIGGIRGYRKMQMREDRLLCPPISDLRCHAGSSATRLLIAAVDLGLSHESHFRDGTGHEVSLGPKHRA